MDFTAIDDFDGDEYGGLLISNADGGGTKDDHERKFMNVINFTDEMYEIIQDERTEPPHPCTDSWPVHHVGENYRMVHGYIALLVCIAGILMNILIIMVLTRKEMRTPINRMLTALAIADMLVMIEYIPFTLHMYILHSGEHEQYSYSWAVFVLFHSHFTQILHTINIQLTISMSIWRYVALKGSGKTSNYLTFSKCNVAILAAYIFPIIVCIPNYLTFSIYYHERLYLRAPFHIILKRKEVAMGSMSNFLKLCQHTSEIMGMPLDCGNVTVKRDWYTVGLSRMAKANNELLHRINFWIFSVLVKLIPCVVLTFFMCWLVNALYKTKRRYKMLQTNKQLTTILDTGGASISENNSFTRMQPSHSHSQQHRMRCNSHTGTGTGGVVAIGVTGENSSTMMQETMLLSPRPNYRNQARLSCPNTNLTRNRDGHGHGHEGYEETTHLQLAGASPATSASHLHPLSASPNTSIITMNGSCSNVPSMVDNNGGSESQINGGTGDDADVDTTSGMTVTVPSCPPRPHIKRKFSRQNLTRVSSLRGMGRRNSHSRSSAPAGSSCSNNNHHSSAAMTMNAAAIARNNSKKVVKRADRTSRLLVAVLVLFLITEIPQGIMAFLSGIYGEQFFKKCYNPWAEVWDILALINSAINFILYCFMSRQFRLQFRMLFQLQRWFKPKWIKNMTNCDFHQTISTTV